jgi:hypothetical protein
MWPKFMHLHRFKRDKQTLEQKQFLVIAIQTIQSFFARRTSALLEHLGNKERRNIRDQRTINSNSAGKNNELTSRFEAQTAQIEELHRFSWDSN